MEVTDEMVHAGYHALERHALRSVDGAYLHTEGMVPAVRDILEAATQTIGPVGARVGRPGSPDRLISDYLRALGESDPLVQDLNRRAQAWWRSQRAPASSTQRVEL